MKPNLDLIAAALLAYAIGLLSHTFARMIEGGSAAAWLYFGWGVLPLAAIFLVAAFAYGKRAP